MSRQKTITPSLLLSHHPTNLIFGTMFFSFLRMPFFGLRCISFVIFFTSLHMNCYLLEGIGDLQKFHSLQIKGYLHSLVKRLFLCTSSQTFSVSFVVQSRSVFCVKEGATILFCFTNLKAIFFVQVIMNLCNEIARCQIIQRKGLCLNLVIKVRVELIFYCNEVLVKNFCSNLL